MQACYIPHYFGMKDKTLNAICFFRVRLQESVVVGECLPRLRAKLLPSEDGFLRIKNVTDFRVVNK